MKTKNKILSSYLILILSILLYSCHTEEITFKENSINNKKNATIITFDELQNKLQLAPSILQKLNNINNKKNGKRTIGGYEFDLDSIGEFQPNDSYQSYTIDAKKENPEEQEYIHKLIIENYNGVITSSMLTFDYKDNHLIPIAQEEFVFDEMSNKLFDCYTIEITVACTCHTHSAPCEHPETITYSGCFGNLGTPTTPSPSTPTPTPGGSGINYGGTTGSTGVLTVEEEALQLYQAFIDNTLNASQRFFLDENSEISDEIFNFFKVNGFSLRNRTEAKNIIEKYRDINNKMIIISPNIPIYNMDEYLECFDLTKSATVTIFVDQPIANSNLVMSAEGVGHTFIGISQQSNRSVFGFYPSGTASPITPSNSGIMGNDASHEFDIAISINISASVLQQIINLSKSYRNYNLNDYNCSDFGIEIANLCNMNFPDCSSSWGIGSGSNPAKLGQHIRNNYPINGYYDVNKNGGTAPPNNKNCN